MSTMGDRIHARRKELRLSQEKLAVMAGLGSQTIWRLEHNSDSKKSSIEAVAKALDVSVEFLLCGGGEAADVESMAS